MGFPVTFRFQKVAETGVELRGEFRFQGVEALHGEFQFFSPGDLHQGCPTLLGDSQVIGQGGVEPGLSGRKGHLGKIERHHGGVECLSRRGQRFRNDGWQR